MNLVYRTLRWDADGKYIKVTLGVGPDLYLNRGDLVAMLEAIDPDIYISDNLTERANAEYEAWARQDD